MMDSREIERMSMLLSTYVERAFTGTKEEVDIRRRGTILGEQLQGNDKCFTLGSRGEGLILKGSDTDIMLDFGAELVMYPNQSIPRNMASKTILHIQKADCRPGYVHLELKKIGQYVTQELLDSLVTVGNSLFLSSDIYRESLCKSTGETWESNGPSCTSGAGDESVDMVSYFPCYSWPKEASEWRTRARLYGWPCQTLIDEIVDSGFSLVPVGDKCSEDTLLQWRISFAKGERSLVHSFTHTQLKVYVLLKCFLKQIKETLANTIGDDDILCSYFLKTVMFHAIENTSQNLWQEKNIFYCFWFCINILIAWVRAGFCPNYFIPASNLFKRKIHGQNQQILLDILNNYCQMKWLCLSVGNHSGSIWRHLRNPSTQARLSCPRTIQDIVFRQDVITVDSVYNKCLICPRKALNVLLTTHSDYDEVFISRQVSAYFARNAASHFYQDHAIATNNKTRYRSIRRCTRLMGPGTSMGTDLLYLATLHFRLGNFRKALDMCERVTQLASCYCSYYSKQHVLMRHTCYNQSDCMWDRLRNIFTCVIIFDDRKINLPHLSLEIMESIRTPPLPYAVFLIFLCCHELGDTRGRDAALHHLVEIRGDNIQGGHIYWIVHTFLGICYQMIGDNYRAIRAYWDSAQSKPHLNEINPAMKRIAIVYLCMYASQRYDSG